MVLQVQSLVKKLLRPVIAYLVSYTVISFTISF